jgi:hypothetical protein
MIVLVPPAGVGRRDLLGADAVRPGAGEDAMAIDASGVLGSRQLADVKVNRRGYAWNLARNQSGNLAADIVLGGQPHPGRTETPPFRLAYLAVTDSELALLRLRARKVFMLKAAYTRPNSAPVTSPRSRSPSRTATPGSWKSRLPASGTRGRSFTRSAAGS